MIIKDKFVLLKDIENIVDIPVNTIRANSIKNGAERTRTILGLIEHRIDHFTKKKVYSFVKKENFNLVYLPKYSLPVTYNKSTKSIIINLASFGVKDISPDNPLPRDLYAAIVYGICFYSLITKEFEVPKRFSQVIVSYLLTMLVRIFGKEYGLLGMYSSQIPKLKFLLSCYVNTAFFDVTGNDMYRTSSMVSSYDYTNEYDELNKYDFHNISSFIASLSNLKVFPGISKYNFAKKIYTFLGIGFLPVLEDCSRFMSVMVTSSVPGISSVLASSSFSKYNEGEFNKIIELSKMIFK